MLQLIKEGEKLISSNKRSATMGVDKGSNSPLYATWTQIQLSGTSKKKLVLSLEGKKEDKIVDPLTRSIDFLSELSSSKAWYFLSIKHPLRFTKSTYNYPFLLIHMGRSHTAQSSFPRLWRSRKEVQENRNSEVYPSIKYYWGGGWECSMRITIYKNGVKEIGFLGPCSEFLVDGVVEVSKDW